MCPSLCNWLWRKPALPRECHQLKPNEYFCLQLCHRLQLLGHGSCSFHCQGGNLGKTSLLTPTASSSFTQWSSGCRDAPWSPEGFTSGRCTLSLRDVFFWLFIALGEDYFLTRFLLPSPCIQSWFLNAADRFVWSGTGLERGKSCPSGRTCLSSKSPPNFGVPGAQDPEENHSGLFPLQAPPPSAVHWNFIFSPWILSRNCNRLVKLVE